MAKILKMPEAPDRSATTAPQDVLREDAATFDVLRRMREDILCCVLKPDQRLRFGELRQRYDTSVGTLREALSHLVARLFNGSPSLLVLNVLEDQAIDRTELKRLKKLIRDG
jgi:Transcriptional regulators